MEAVQDLDRTDTIACKPPMRLVTTAWKKGPPLEAYLGSNNFFEPLSITVRTIFCSVHSSKKVVYSNQEAKPLQSASLLASVIV